MAAIFSMILNTIVFVPIGCDGEAACVPEAVSIVLNHWSEHGPAW